MYSGSGLCQRAASIHEFLFFTVERGDFVLTEDGTFQRVVNKFSQGYREKLLRVKVDRMPNVLDVTPLSPFIN